MKAVFEELVASAESRRRKLVGCFVFGLLVLLSADVRDETRQRRRISPIHRRIARGGNRQVRVEEQSRDDENGNDGSRRPGP